MLALPLDDASLADVVTFYAIIQGLFTPWSAKRPEHVAAHDGGADTGVIAPIQLSTHTPPLKRDNESRAECGDGRKEAKWTPSR